MAGDSAPVRLSYVQNWRTCLPLTFTYMETDGINRAGLWERLIFTVCNLQQK